MKPEQRSKSLLGITRSKAKMYEYEVPTQYHISIPRDPSRLFTLAIGILGDLAAHINSDDADAMQLAELRDNLRFSAHFFDAYCESKLNKDLNPYLLILGSASYYLCNFPGSSSVLARRLQEDIIDLDLVGLDKLITWLLKEDFSEVLDNPGGLFGNNIRNISYLFNQYFLNGSGEIALFDKAKQLRETAYASGSPRQLLFADVICALIKKHHDNSKWYCIPWYSGLSILKWLPILKKQSFIKELWPAQHLLGEYGVFSGTSAVVQMPTSAGKTRATEIIIRSAFLSNRTSLAVIIAPFRALCHEIRDSLVKAFQNESLKVVELSDVLQADFEINISPETKQVLVVTPEKLVYILRHVPELADRIGLLIYEEGHLFDSGIRGATYELLLTSLKAMVPEKVQTILISAVISNAESINGWINGNDSKVVSGIKLGPTYRTIAFVSWLDPLGRLEFVAENDPDKREFFVPRIIEQYRLQRRPMERNTRFFPEKGDGKSVALYLGLKLVHNGGVAIFCGTKATATRLCEKIVEAYNRNLPTLRPADSSNQGEIQRLCNLHECNLGIDATASQSARLGVLAHHGNTPHGIRLSVEHAMKEGLARFVICTSTLAQGINIPIRYLIVTSIYQGEERIKVRDFHNLIGRAGRSGMHTEGSIIFADPEVYDRRDIWGKWPKVKELLEPGNSEPCISALLSIFDPWVSDDRRYKMQTDQLTFVQTYIDNPSKLDEFVDEIVARYGDKGFTKPGLEKQISRKMNIIAAIESYLMAHSDDSEPGIMEASVVKLAQGTLAHHLADIDKRKYLIDLFKMLAKNIEMNVSNSARRKAFGKTLFGIRDSIAIENWTTQNIEKIAACKTQEELLLVLWPVLAQHIQNSTFKKSCPEVAVKELATGWIQGCPFYELFAALKNAKVKIGIGKRPRQPQIEHVVDICENGLAYDGMLVIGAIIEMYGLLKPDQITVIENLKKLQKRVKYGLKSQSSIVLYELGFADRVVSMELDAVIGTSFDNKQIAVREITKKIDIVRYQLNKYPSYFTDVLNAVLL